MVFDNPVKIAFLISLVCHSCLIFSLPGIEAIYRKSAQGPLEVTYYKIKKAPRITDSRPALKKVLRQKELEIQKKKELIERLKKQTEIKKVKKRDSREIIRVKKQGPKGATLVRQATAKASRTPAYLEYGQAIHERVRAVANKRYGS